MKKTAVQKECQCPIVHASQWFLVVLVVVLGHAHKVEESLGAASGRQQQGTAATTNQ